ncbi:hypothetical protein ONK27_26995, partial [Salmonella enterica subsp. enterica serovar Virginia]|nr:hypothetical protein [Salmonella enterica subsp. enterica serovar Virginia]
PKLFDAVRNTFGFNEHLLHDMHHRLTPIEAARFGKCIEDYRFGKTTLLRHILNEQHGFKIAVIENEFGEVSVDDQLIGDRATQI